MLNRLFKKKETPEEKQERLQRKQQVKRSKARAKGNRGFAVHTDGQTMQDALEKEGERIEEDQVKMDNLKQMMPFMGGDDEEPKKKKKDHDRNIGGM